MYTRGWTLGDFKVTIKLGGTLLCQPRPKSHHQINVKELTWGFFKSFWLFLVNSMHRLKGPDDMDSTTLGNLIPDQKNVCLDAQGAAAHAERGRDKIQYMHLPI
jgi:hypothetical protein